MIKTIEQFTNSSYDKNDSFESCNKFSTGVYERNY